MITVNGTEQPFYPGITLGKLLQQMEYDISRIAVELNGTIIPKSKYAAYLLSPADSLEIVSFVGGG